ncbi:energy-coupling factor ABC transporter ATP-binding protein [Pelolinea submarina]|uniref:Cobalt/nickel transport system ATP-binding protein n=1 Tax=Pelolinea submarina TaxID=913107 RepID=A0A347ZWV6_9CHLR|nr:ABC transporter ATP-binding protein [Pelolinea submarina]REG05530.1 cobalt/nickel transport system ATP-binding protein [Pelolinea submarina]BBB49787.1 cobalt/nickel transport system ATP-binding protein [Pelolinea submarina]
MISINDLSFAYDDGRMAIEHVSLDFKPGEKAALVGPNGAGKTTLLLHLNGILRGQGSVVVGEQAVDDRTIKAIRARVGLVFQSPDDQLFSSSVFDDVAYGLVYQGEEKIVIREKVAQALEVVGMPDSQARSPYHLSLGEKKRVALATVLCMQPEVLALDEPTAGLDPRGRRGILNLLADLDQTLIVATHDLEMVREIFPRVIIMDAGRVVYDGETQAALADRALLEAHGLIG